MAKKKPSEMLQANIKFIREYKRYTYQEFGDAIKASTGQAKTYELRGVTPPLQILCNIADFARVSLDALIREKITADNLRDLKTPLADYQLKQIKKRLEALEALPPPVRKFAK
jgi:transcriptional regulator with XRE-family HTH domain